MPTYCYETKNGEVHERVFPMGKAPRSIKIDGHIAKRAFAAEMASVPSTTGWPLECFGSGVNAADAQKLSSLLKAKGVPTEVSADGNPIYQSANHRRRALKARGLFDKASYC